MAAKQQTAKKNSSSLLLHRIKRHFPFYIMFLPAAILFILFAYVPMLNIDIAFYKFSAFKGRQEFVGLYNFIRLFNAPKFWEIFSNTLVISFTRLILNMVTSIVFALMLNEVSVKWIKKSIQTVVYIPHFLSWVIVASIFTMLLSPTTGVTGQFYEFLGLKPENPLTNSLLWRPIFYVIGTWKETGWGAIVYLAAVTSIDPALYEAAAIDGAGRWKQTLKITLPSLLPTVLVVLILNLSKVLNLFDPVFVLQNALVYRVSDVLGTYVYRVGLQDQDYAYSTAIGLFRSVVSLFLILSANFASKKIRGNGII